MGTLIHKVAHGLVADQRIYLVNLVGGLGIDDTTLYYVLAAGLTADDFKVSETSGGTAVVYTTDITDGAIINKDTYTSINDGNMSPPTAPSAPGSCVLSSAAVLGPDGTTLSRLDITITQPTSATLRHTIVTITGGSNTVKVVIPVGQTTGSIASVIPGISYTGSAVAYDTFGLASTSTTSAAHVAAGDTTAPAQVTSAAAVGAIRGAIVSWAGSASTDLSHYELQVDTSNLFGTATTYKVKVSVAVITELAVGTWYFRIRAVDLTGNLGTYSATVSAVSRLVTGGSDIVANSITANDVLAGSLTADTLSIGARTGQASLVPNHSFEDNGGNGSSNIKGWTISTSGGGLGYAETHSLGAVDGAYACTLYALVGGASHSQITSSRFGVTPGEVLYMQAHLWPTMTAAGCVYFRIDFFKYDGTASATSSIDVTAGGSVVSAVEQTLKGYVTVPSDATFADIQVYNFHPTATGYILWDNIVVQRGAGALVNSTGYVTINASGITITNGALTIQDEFGKSTLGASGFTGSWYDFVRLGLYNARFLSGSNASNIAVGRTAACGYWTLAKTVGTPTFDQSTTNGLTVNMTALNQAVTVLSDKVPCRPSQKYQATLTVTTASATLITLSADLFWYKADGTASSTPSTNTPFRTAAVSFSGTGTVSYEMDAATAPTDAKFAAVKITLTETLHGSSCTVTLNAVGLQPAVSENQTGLDPIFPSKSCKAIRSSNQTVTGPGGTAMLSFNAADEWDSYAMHDPSGTPTRITAIWDGKYEIISSAHCAPVATLPTRLILELFKNGAAYPIGAVTGTGQRLIMPNAQTFDQHMQGTWELTMVAGDYIEIHVEHNSATSQTVKAAEVIVNFMGS